MGEINNGNPGANANLYQFLMARRPEFANYQSAAGLSLPSV
jgi:hypothetical protein